MSIRSMIEQQFEERVFTRPLFYTHPLGLRFELSEGNTLLERFMTALRKAMEISSSIFADESSIPVCLRVWTNTNPFRHREVLANLKVAGLTIPKQREVWLEPMDLGEGIEPIEPMFWLNVAFEIPKELLQNVLWCALARDLSPIQPNTLGCMFYLFSAQKRIVVFPYDDRGMDVVGPDWTTLKVLYTVFEKYLLEYDRQKMDQIFGAENNKKAD
jgi:Domain of unknown function (DUF3885)